MSNFHRRLSYGDTLILLIKYGRERWLKLIIQQKSDFFFYIIHKKHYTFNDAGAQSLFYHNWK